MPTLAFEHQRLTSFAGLVLFWRLFKNIRLLPHLEACFQHLRRSSIFTYGRIILLLIVHVLAGYRRLRDICLYKHDPLIKRVLGLNALPDVSTIRNDRQIHTYRAFFSLACSMTTLGKIRTHL